MNDCKGNRKQRDYLVYSFQYSEMKKPKVDARMNKKLSGGLTTLDTLPPTVKELFHVDACNKKEAILKAKHLFKNL